MPFSPHPEFKAPANSDARIWRYSDLAKFLSLIDKAALYFPRLDKLDDRFEGYYTKKSPVVDISNLTPAQVKASLKTEDDNLVQEILRGGRMLREFSKMQREITFVNSWHCQEHESAAMWAQYLKTQEGIAIQSTYSRLCAALSDYKEYEVYIGMVNYLDYDSDTIVQGNALTPVISKRRSFEHERELRAVVWTMQHGKNGWGLENKLKDSNGLYVPVSTSSLIERVYVAPTAPGWVRELLESLMKKFGLSAPVLQSSLAEAPFY
jgi:hypothetical protein